MRFSSRDLDCRYLSILHGERGSFEPRCKGLGLDLTSGLLTRLVDTGLLVPALSVPLPARFIEEWVDFPVLRGSFSQDLGWAADVWAFATGQYDVWPKRSSLDRVSWWVHPFDDPGHDFGNTVRGTHLGARPAPKNATAEGARGQRFRTLVDFIPYWEAFRLAELLQDLSLFPRVLALADNEESSATVLDHLPDLWNDAQDRVTRTKKTWAEMAPVFDWISRYRTLWAAAIHFKVDRNSIQNAVEKLAGDLNLTPERVREDIRERLLVLWNSWSWKRRSSFSAQLLTSLQYDIAAAVDLLEIAFGQGVDPFEEFWDPPDPNPRLWTRLKVALPYEKWQCQETTWQVAPSYLKNCLRVLPLRAVEGHHCLRKLVRQSWPASVHFRRFCVAFARLHEELRTSRVLEGDNYLRLGLPVEFLRLCTLETERFLASTLQEQRAPSGLNKLLEEVFEPFAERLGASPSNEEKSELKANLKEKTKLFGLPDDRSLPFLDLSEIRASETTCFLMRVLVDFAILRNYSAHHDVLDESIHFDGEAMPGIESTLALVGIGLGWFSAPSRP